MQTLTAPKTMLICPKCQKVYENGAQRFCLNDGARLNTQNVKINSAQSTGVFSGVLKKKGLFEERTDLENLSPKLLRIQPEPEAKIKKSEPEITKPETEIPKKAETEIKQPETPQTFSKLIKPDEILSNQTPLGDRKIKPVGRVALSADNPNILLGQTVKGRYFIKSRISQTAHSIKYLATDKLNSDRKVIVRIFTGKLDGSDFSAKIFSIERVSLSHINHPNVANVFDSGELPEGNPFIVSDFVKGIPLKENISGEKSFGLLQTARLVKQAADALGEAHRNGVLHRNVNPENLFLSVSETGNEQVKVTDFNIFSDKARGDFSFLAPEQLEGKSAEISSDQYSLAVVAYKMLTGAMPFSALTSKELWRAQKKGLRNLPSNLDDEIPAETDEVLRKAMSFDPIGRFQSIRHFGEAFYKSLTSENAFSEIEVPAKSVSKTEDFELSLDLVLDETDGDEKQPEKKISQPLNILEQPEIPALLKAEEIQRTFDEEQQPFAKEEPVELELEQPARVIKFGRAGDGAKVPENSENADKSEKIETEIPWEKRSIEPPPQGGKSLTLFSILGIALLFVLTGLIFYYFINRPAEQKYANIPAANQPAQNEIAQNPANQNPTENKNDINEIPPPARTTIEQPAGTTFFENSKENLSVELLKNYRGFKLFYPNDWKVNKFDKNRNKVDNKFIDISKNNADGLPLEQFMVSYYDSEGTFDLDKEKFPAIVEKASDEIKKSPLPNFQLVGTGAVNLNKAEGYEGWKAYEMKFQGEGTALNGDKIKLFGRRFYIPAARPGVKKGLVVTLLGTSLSDEIKSADDLGTKGDLKTILSTFEPDQNF